MNNVYSPLKVFHHKDALDALEAGRQAAPFYIRLKPTNMCNHHCSYCTYGSGNTQRKTDNRDNIQHADMIPWTKLQEIIADMGEMGVKAVTLSGGGEPLVYPHILEAIRQIKAHNIELSIITNGQLLEGSTAQELYNARWVRISFDSPVESEYCRLRSVSPRAFQAVCENIRSFAEHKNPGCVLGINFVVGKDNFSHVYHAAKLLSELGVDNVKFAALVDNAPEYHADIKDEVIAQIHRAKHDFESGKFHIFNNYENDWQDKNFTLLPFSTCYTCRMVSVIAADSKLYLCHTRAYDSGAELADLSEQSFKQAWFSEEVIRKLRAVNPHEDCKNFCAYESRNRLIQEYFDVDLSHVNFI
ncbi:MAG: radical SAM protein [Synergistaceae bacterium]|nr:radical SAM protein [Synergistaceae bacterium]